MLLFFFTQIIFSQTLTQDLKFRYFGYLLGETRYDTIQLNIEAGVALMMVEWDKAQLTIEIPSKGIVFKLTKELGLSLFTFSNPATVKITNIKSKISYNFFSSPFIASDFLGASMYISNIASNEITIQRTNKDLYFCPFGIYDLTTSLSQSGFGAYEYRYYQNGNVEPTKTTDFLSKTFSNIIHSSIFQNILNGKLDGKMTLKVRSKYTPTIPTHITLNFESVAGNINNFNSNVAYGGIGEEATEFNLDEIPNQQFIVVQNNLKKNDKYKLFVRHLNNEYEYLKPKQFYWLKNKNRFQIELLMRSSHCSEYVLVKTITSTQLTSSDGNAQIYQIGDNDIPECCVHPDNKAKSILIAVFVIITVALVAALIAVTVIFMKKLKQIN